MHGIRSAQRELQRGCAAVGMTGNVRPPAGHALDNRQRILRLLGDTEGPRVVSASEETPTVVVSDLVAVRERRLVQRQSNASPVMLPWMRTRGSPVPFVSNSSSPPLTGNRSM